MYKFNNSIVPNKVRIGWHFSSNKYAYSLGTLIRHSRVGLEGCRMFRPMTGSAHGPNQPFSQPLNREVFLLSWAESTVYATGAGKWGLWTLLRSLFLT